ncbi:SAM-dependent methyltransferase [Sphingobacterium alkalisoli]|uniref:SAM-dependent methyltransferase n=1 Tax=Sphingobacterium alkalisoli TaxID=1874115 RepID=A0A4U0HBD3_9SPHI|nr:SAM-dependent methyltransferase [Sphingobacterium alkalisoli]TJY67882.1 SAM-dependent methyltransferase [Sphingobacterium alkalisoli]GGH10711.1 S-adenosylmethionine-dependent methyltransferase [Sphingobacterium alkalisoli]
MNAGKLYLIPVPLAEGAEKSSYTFLHQEIIDTINEYVVENEKTARRFLKLAGLKIPQNQLIMHDYGKHARGQMDYGEVFANVLKGKDIGLMSEAGCPAVADPGSDIVLEAHKRGIQVIPLVGPSSILLALMASGFNGQKFTFQGYLPIDKGERAKRIKDLENQSAREKMTQIFIETPFRNNQLLSELLRICKPSTLLSISSNLTAADEQIKTMSIAAWKKKPQELHKIPAIFLLFV